MSVRPAPVHPAPDCARCAHHYITHDAGFPYGCRALGFKSYRKPCLEVLETSGAPCLAFLAKAGSSGSNALPT